MGEVNEGISKEMEVGSVMSDIDMTQVYFLKNKAWYYFDYDDDERGIKLTELGKNNKKVVKSYEEFYATGADDEISL